MRYIPAWVPGAGFQKVAADWKKLVRGFGLFYTVGS